MGEIILIFAGVSLSLLVLYCVLMSIKIITVIYEDVIRIISNGKRKK